MATGRGSEVRVTTCIRFIRPQLSKPDNRNSLLESELCQPRLLLRLIHAQDCQHLRAVQREVYEHKLQLPQGFIFIPALAARG